MGNPRQITVFGGTGFIGRHIIRRLAKTGAVIRVPTREPEKALFLKPMGDIGQIVPLPCSVRSEASIAAAIGPSDTVINLIGILNERGRETFLSVHVETAARIARVAKERGADRFVQMSALGANPGSASSYARSKAAGEQAARAFFADATVFRPSLFFGPEDNFFNLFAKMTKISPVLPLIGGGMTKFQPIYVGDVAEAVVRSLETDATRGQLFELGGPGTYTVRDMLEMIMRVTGRKRSFVNLPWPVAMIEAFVLEQLPHPLLTRDQVRFLKADNVVGNARAKGLREFGITPTALEAILPTYLR
jgi:uncharacterized protein YbjT (DUF2867 family)